jgi:hypothetical protein
VEAATYFTAECSAIELLRIILSNRVFSNANGFYNKWFREASSLASQDLIVVAKGCEPVVQNPIGETP